MQHEMEMLSSFFVGFFSQRTQAVSINWLYGCKKQKWTKRKARARKRGNCEEFVDYRLVRSSHVKHSTK